MLYGQSKQYLLEKLTEAGLRSVPDTEASAETAPKSVLGMKRERNTNGARFSIGLSPSLYS